MSGDPMILILFALAVVLAIDDWRYKLKGGKRPTKREKTFLLVSILVFVILEGLTSWMFSVFPDGDVAMQAADALGRLTAIVTAFFFFGWEIRRWRVRRKNPLSGARTPAQNQPPS